MKRHCWTTSWMAALMLAGLAAFSAAQSAPATHGGAAGRSGRGAFGFAARLDKEVGLTPEQSDSVRGLLAAQRQKSQAMREETDQKIRAVLNPDQQKKFDAMLAEQKARFARFRGNNAQS